MVGEKKWTPYLLLIPWIIGIIIFKIYPFFSSFYSSLFTKVGRTQQFVGFKNYIQIFTSSDMIGARFINSLQVTAIYVFITVPLILIVSLLIAQVLSKKLKGVGFFRTSFYIPTLLGANVAVLLLWRNLFENYGLINQFLKIVGAQPVNWFGTGAGAMTTIILLRVWQFGSTMLIFLGALQNIPETLYEAATMDGAGKVRTFFSVTIPQLTPIILFNGVMRLVESFQVFNGPALITGGDPNYKTETLNLLIYETAFQMRNLNLGNAMSWVLFVILMIFTLLIFRSSRHWVHYGD